MITAKSHQFLDDNNNNISPITNIESIYYEINEGGIVYRNALYQHFPVYVKYNNNIDNPITTAGMVAFTNASIGKVNSSLFDDAGVLLKENNGTNKPADLLITAMRQSRLGNTRYHKLDISTYNMTDILSLYAPKKYTVNRINDLIYKVSHVKYESKIIKNNTVGQFKTLYQLGSYPKGTDISELNDHELNDIIDQAFFKEVAP